MRFQVAQYEGIVPVYQSRLKDTEEQNKRLDEERAHLTKNIEQKLNKAEALVFSMGTPEAIRQRGPVIGSSAHLFPRLFPPSSHDDQNNVGAHDVIGRNLVEPVDLSISPTEPEDAIMETRTAPVIKLTFKEIISSGQKQVKAEKNMEGSAGTSGQPTPSRVISLSTLGGKNEDTVGKRTRSLGTVAKEPAQKKPPQNSHASSHNSSELPQSTKQISRVRNHDMEKEIEEKVRKSCQNIQWVRGPLPTDVDHWFYDLRDAGTVPPESLVAASRLMVLAWKEAQGRGYFTFRRLAGGMVMRIEHAHRTFNAEHAHLWLGFQSLRKTPC